MVERDAAPELAGAAREKSAEDLYENAPCGYFSTLDDGTFVRINETFLTWTGYRREDLVGRRRIHDLFAPGDRIYYETHYAPLLWMQGAVREIAVDVVCANGGRLPVIVNSVLKPGSDQASTLIRTTVFAATDRRRYEHELLRARREAERLVAERDSERRRLGHVLGVMHEGVVSVDQALRVQFANAAAQTVDGLESIEVGELIPDAWPGFSLRAFVAALFSGVAEERHAAHAPSPDASYAITAIPPHLSNELVLVFTDLSASARREQAEREFVANAAHELRTPLSGILGSVEALQGGAREIPEKRDLFLAHIQREVVRLVRLTRALLVLAEVQAQNVPASVEPVDLRSLLHAVAADLDVREGVAVEVNCEAGLRTWTNADLVTQALASTAANAAKYTPAGRISLSAFTHADGATIVVTDTGPGIPAEHYGRLFERFYRGGEHDGDGFGLGLAIANQAVRALRGTINLRSGPEGGTAVELRLPSHH